eukprot:474290-Pelagomonas_calceolata.AAC.1
MASGRLEVRLCLSGKRRGKMNLGRFCRARRSALPMSMEARPAPNGPLLTPLRRILLAML